MFTLKIFYQWQNHQYNTKIIAVKKRTIRNDVKKNQAWSVLVSYNMNQEEEAGHYF